MSKEAMTLALEALEYIYEGANNQGPHTGISWRCVSNKAEPVITALREALAEQPAQQEPVADEVRCPECGYLTKHTEHIGCLRKQLNAINAFEQRNFAIVNMDKFPPAQRTWVGLTDEEVDEWTPEIHSVIRAIEDKLKEKNT